MDAVDELQRRYLGAIDALREQRQQIEEDQAFSDPSNPQQWDAKVKSQREGDPGGMRPCRVYDQCGQYVANVAGQVEQNPPAIHALPVGDGADKRTAEQIDGFFRHIEHTSRAKQHYARALTSAARTGVGYLIVKPEYVNRALGWQEPRIGSEGDALRIVLDPWSLELDGSDADFGFWLKPMSHSAFERAYGAKAEKRSFSDRDRRYINDERESIVTAEYWQAEDSVKAMIICRDISSLDGDEVAVTEDEYWKQYKDGGSLEVVMDERGAPTTYKEKKRIIKWGLVSGAAELVKETEYPASGIGIVPVYGYVGYSDGRMKYCGIPRRAMEPQRSYNLHMSEMEVLMSQGAKAPYMIPIRAFGGSQNLQELWDRASVESRAYMTFHDWDQNGPIRPPERMQPGVNLQNHIAGAQQAIHDIQAALGMYQASLGAPSNESSGVAIEQRKAQGEAATSHFPAHLSAALCQIGKLGGEMIPRGIDKKRQVRILSIDHSPGTVTIDPGQKDSVVETDGGLSINPNVGKYDFRVVVGASFATQRSQAQEAFTALIHASPEMAPLIAPFMAQTMDFQHSDKFAQVLIAMMPEQARAIMDPDGAKQPKTADLMAKVSELQGALQEAVQHAQDAQAEADQAKQEAADKTEADQVAWFKAETDRLKVTGANETQIQAIVTDLVTKMLEGPQRLPGDPQPGPGAWQQQAMPMDDAPGMQDGPGMDGAPMQEQAEPAQFEQQQPMQEQPQ